MRTVLAIDIGASSGRVVAGYLEKGCLVTHTIHRFANGYQERNGHLVWDLPALFAGILAGLKAAGTLYDDIVSIAIDTWGVDYVLLDKKGEIIGDSFSYRDHRTDNVVCPLSEEELYRITGIQYLNFNTLYQLLWTKANHPEWLDDASALLQIPDYLGYLLTGVMAQEYTNATTTNMVSATTRTWSEEIIRSCRFPSCLFTPLHEPSTELGLLSPKVVAAVGFQCMVHHAPSHDTASAVLGTPLLASSAFLSSGTWSLLGCELDYPNLSEESQKANYSNEGGVEGSIRYLKNLMGLWMIQSIRKEAGERITFAQLEEKARESLAFPSLVDVEDTRFLSPSSMGREIQDACREQGLKVPETTGELASVVYNSLAHGYAKAIKGLELLTGHKFSRLTIVGGGTKDQTLCGLTAKMAGIEVVLGPVEGTASGNILSQFIALKDIKDRTDARSYIASDKERA